MSWEKSTCSSIRARALRCSGAGRGRMCGAVRSGPGPRTPSRRGWPRRCPGAPVLPRVRVRLRCRGRCGRSGGCRCPGRARRLSSTAGSMREGSATSACRRLGSAGSHSAHPRPRPRPHGGLPRGRRAKPGRTHPAGPMAFVGVAPATHPHPGSGHRLARRGQARPGRPRRFSRADRRGRPRRDRRRTGREPGRVSRGPAWRPPCGLAWCPPCGLAWHAPCGLGWRPPCGLAWSAVRLGVAPRRRGAAIR